MQGPATQASSVWGVAGPTLAQRLGQQQQSQSRPDSASIGPASCIPPSQVGAGTHVHIVPTPCAVVSATAATAVVTAAMPSATEKRRYVGLVN